MTQNITFVAAEQRAVALRLLFSRFPVDEQSTRLADALRSVEKGCLNLDGLLLAEQDGLPIGAALMMLQPDRVALVWPPVMSCQASDFAAAERLLMIRLCEEIDRVGAKLAQALIAPGDVRETELLQGHGFHHAADMFFLARSLTEEDLAPTTLDDDLDHDIFCDIFCDANANRFASTIELTYQGSLDCPFLDGFRSGKEALFSHRLSGNYDPAGWRIYRRGTDDIGVLMMNEHPDQNAIELVYFGIVPQFRGLGFGRRMLAEGMRAAALTGRTALFLAVDCGNTYANTLYSEVGFTELARRRVLVRRSLEVAHE